MAGIRELFEHDLAERGEFYIAECDENGKVLRLFDTGSGASGRYRVGMATTTKTSTRKPRMLKLKDGTEVPIREPEVESPEQREAALDFVTVAGHFPSSFPRPVLGPALRDTTGSRPTAAA